MSAWPDPGPCCLQKIIGIRHQQKKKLKHICDIFRRSVKQHDHFRVQSGPNQTALLRGIGSGPTLITDFGFLCSVDRYEVMYMEFEREKYHVSQDLS